MGPAIGSVNAPCRTDATSLACTARNFGLASPMSCLTAVFASGIALAGTVGVIDSRTCPPHVVVLPWALADPARPARANATTHARTCQLPVEFAGSLGPIGGHGKPPRSHLARGSPGPRSRCPPRPPASP